MLFRNEVQFLREGVGKDRNFERENGDFWNFEDVTFDQLFISSVMDPKSYLISTLRSNHSEE